MISSTRCGFPSKNNVAAHPRRLCRPRLTLEKAASARCLRTSALRLIPRYGRTEGRIDDMGHMHARVFFFLVNFVQLQRMNQSDPVFCFFLFLEKHCFATRDIYLYTGNDDRLNNTNKALTSQMSYYTQTTTKIQQMTTVALATADTCTTTRASAQPCRTSSLCLTQERAFSSGGRLTEKGALHFQPYLAFTHALTSAATAA